MRVHYLNSARVVLLTYVDIHIRVIAQIRVFIKQGQSVAFEQDKFDVVLPEQCYEVGEQLVLTLLSLQSDEDALLLNGGTIDIQTFV